MQIGVAFYATSIRLVSYLIKENFHNSVVNLKRFGVNWILHSFTLKARFPFRVPQGVHILFIMEMYSLGFIRKPRHVKCIKTFRSCEETKIKLHFDIIWIREADFFFANSVRLFTWTRQQLCFIEHIFAFRPHVEEGEECFINANVFLCVLLLRFFF